jgi:hypothetical protein
MLTCQPRNPHADILRLVDRAIGVGGICLAQHQILPRYRGVMNANVAMLLDIKSITKSWLPFNDLLAFTLRWMKIWQADSSVDQWGAERLTSLNALSPLVYRQ